MGSSSLPYDIWKPWEVAWFYGLDWVAGFLLLVASYPVHNAAHTQRFFIVDDPALSFPYKSDTVFSGVLAIISLAVPLILGIGVELLLYARKTWWPVMLDCHFFLLGFLQTHGITLLATLAMKNAVGFYRPSAFERIDEGKSGFNESYPSGHTSFSFAGLSFIAFFFAGKLGVFSKAGLRLGFRKNKDDPFRGCFAVAMIVVFLPIAVATFCGISRIFDYAHHPFDVNAGAAIGVSSSAFAYYLNFAPLTDEFSLHCRPMAFCLSNADGKEIPNGNVGSASVQDVELGHMSY